MHHRAQNSLDINSRQLPGTTPSDRPSLKSRCNRAGADPSFHWVLPYPTLPSLVVGPELAGMPGIRDLGVALAAV